MRCRPCYGLACSLSRTTCSLQMDQSLSTLSSTSLIDLAAGSGHILLRYPVQPVALEICPYLVHSDFPLPGLIQMLLEVSVSIVCVVLS